jgi:pilus assembly protein CpaD
MSKSRLAPAIVKLVIATTLATGLAACGKDHDEYSGHVAGWSIIDPNERHPIMVTQQPTSMSLRIPRGAAGLAPHQRSQLAQFLYKYRTTDAGHSTIKIAVPSGSANEVAAMNAAQEMRQVFAEAGLTAANVTIEPYHDNGDPQPPIRLTYSKFVAEGPECGHWDENLARSERNLNYNNFGCSQQRNLAAQIANPADLVQMRTRTPAAADRRVKTYDKYMEGTPSGAVRSPDESATKN